MKDLFIKSLIFNIFICFGFKNSLYAQTKLSEVDIFHKCHMKFLKSVVPRTASLGQKLMENIKAKSMTGVQACAALIDQTEFYDNANLKPVKNSNLPRLTEKEQFQIVSTFHNFHNTWFSQKSFNFENSTSFDSNILVKDNDEASLYFTKALFDANTPVSLAFTGNSSLKGIRKLPANDAATNWKRKPFFVRHDADYGRENGFLLSFNYSTNLSSIALNDNQIVSFGKLVGVESPEPLNVPVVFMDTHANIKPAFQSLLNTKIDEKRRGGINLFEHLGGGLLGSQNFILKNTNLLLHDNIPGGYNNDIESVIARRISSRVFENLLCQQLPTLTEEDVINDVKIDSANTFRQNASCMACHMSLDPMAFTYRNVVPYVTSTNEFAETVEERKKGSPVHGVSKLNPINDDSPIPLQPPKGHLQYRDHLGKMVKVPVTGLSELGQALSNSDDFYRCVSKRYYQFLTGYDVVLAEKDIDPVSNTKAGQFHRKKIYEIAQNLKSHQSLNQMINEILKSEAFIYRNFDLTIK